MKDCDCITHDGPHWRHMDAIRKAQNCELLEQMQRYQEATKSTQDVTEAVLYHGTFLATAQCYAEAELSRLAEKAVQMEREEKKSAICPVVRENQ
jgi:hypothetical protein